MHEKLHNSSNTKYQSNKRMTRMAWQTACKRQEIMAYGIFMEKVKERDHSEDRGAEGG